MRMATLLWMLVSCCALCGALAKTQRNYYTPERLVYARENIARYEWAQRERDQIIKEATRWAAYDDERLRELVPPPQVPRAAVIHPDECPIHGSAVRKAAGLYGWKMDFDHPYKVVCPVGGETYPSNDFYAYLKSGFQDKTLLQGEYVDDGWGYKKNPADKFAYWFVAYYAHWMAYRWLLPALKDLSQAYLLTGDMRFAHKCALLLWQLATYYPDYAFEKQSQRGKEIDPSYLGRLLYHTWETWTVENAALAYDAIFPALAADTDLQRMAGLDGPHLARYIEDRLLRTMAEDIIGGSHRIQGNWGMHQKAALLVALVLDTKEGRPTSPQIVDWVLDNRTPSPMYTDTGFRDMLFNLLHRDGIPFESPSYNCGWMVNLAEIADLLQANGVDLWTEPRLQRVYLAPLAMLCAEHFTPSLGDSNHLFGGALGTTAPYQERAWAHMRRPEQAKAIVQTGGPDQFSRDLFRPFWGDQIIRQAESVKEEIGVTSQLLPGLGFLTLQAGEPDRRFALALYYGYYVGHAHFDPLQLDLYGYGWALTPDLGYPETADSADPRRYGFLAHTVAHNTCMLDASRSELARGQLVAFHPGGFAQFAEATARGAYPDRAQDYRRAVFLIMAEAGQPCIVDLFHVLGGRQHDWLLHGTEAEFSSSLPFTPPQEQGTLAGPDVPYRRFYDDPQLAEGQYGANYYAYRGSAFQWLFNVQRAQQRANDSPAPWAQWKTNRDPNLFPKEAVRGAVLRAYLVPQEETIFACDGIPQRRPQFPDRLKWLVRRRIASPNASDGALRSTFVTVYEIFHGAPYTRSVRRLPVQPAEQGAAAVEIRLATGRLLVFWTPEPSAEYRVGPNLSVRGRAAVLFLDTAGRVRAARLFDGSHLQLGAWQLTAPGTRTTKIAHVDYTRGVVTLEQPCLTAADEGRWIPCTSSSHEASLQIERVLSPRQFSCAQQDLRTGRGFLVRQEGVTVTTNAPLYFAEPGMTIVDEAGKPLARLVQAKSLEIKSDRPLPATLPDEDHDGVGRFIIMAVGPGDTAQIGCVAEYVSQNGTRSPKAGEK